MVFKASQPTKAPPSTRVIRSDNTMLSNPSQDKNALEPIVVIEEGNSTVFNLRNAVNAPSASDVIPSPITMVSILFLSSYQGMSVRYSYVKVISPLPSK